LYAQSYQAKLRLAKDAAENGLTVVASEFNYPGNRLVLGGAGGQGINTLGRLDPNILLWEPDVIPANINADSNSGQPCYIYSRAGGAIRQSNQAISGQGEEGNVSGFAVTDKNIIYKPSVVLNGRPGRYDGVNNTSWFDSISRSSNDFYYLGNGQFYRIIALRLYNSDHTANNNSDHTANSSDAPPYAMAAKGQVSYLTVAVEGVYNSRSSVDPLRGLIVAPDTRFVNSINSVKYTMQQEFQVVPRCCGKGFGTVNEIAYGPSDADSSACPPNTQTEWILRSVSRTSAFNPEP
jgi:hypothetical protein